MFASFLRLDYSRMSGKLHLFPISPAAKQGRKFNEAWPCLVCSSDRIYLWKNEQKSIIEKNLVFKETFSDCHILHKTVNTV